jgi:hypothetical protein
MKGCRCSLATAARIVAVSCLGMPPWTCQGRRFLWPLLVARMAYCLTDAAVVKASAACGGLLLPRQCCGCLVNKILPFFLLQLWLLGLSPYCCYLANVAVVLWTQNCRLLLLTGGCHHRSCFFTAMFALTVAAGVVALLLLPRQHFY